MEKRLPIVDQSFVCWFVSWKKFVVGVGFKSEEMTTLGIFMTRGFFCRTAAIFLESRRFR